MLVVNSDRKIQFNDGPSAYDTVSYNYGTNLLRSGLSVVQPNASAWQQTYAYDAARRLTNTTSPAGAVSYEYYANPGGGDASPSALIKKRTLPSGAYVTNAFDSVARLTGTVIKNSSHSALNSHVYGYNLAHEILFY